MSDETTPPGLFGYKPATVTLDPYEVRYIAHCVQSDLDRFKKRRSVLRRELSGEPGSMFDRKIKELQNLEKAIEVHTALIQKVLNG